MRYLQINTRTASVEVLNWMRTTALVKEGFGWAKFTLGSHEIDLEHNHGITVREVTAKNAELFGALMSQGFGFPPSLGELWRGVVGKQDWICLVGYLDGEPIATGAMYIYSDCAWLGVATTLPNYRNKGAQKALIRARLQIGFQRGVRIFTVETSQPEFGMEAQSISFMNVKKIGVGRFILAPILDSWT